MSILKNDPIYEFKEGDYTKPHHIIVAGSYEEIGFDLATIAKNDYGCQLGIYDDPIYARGRKAYMEMHWPEMEERAKGVRKAYGLDDNDVVYDAYSLPFDWYDASTTGSLGGRNTCSHLVLPIEKSENGHMLTGRNYDMSPLPCWSVFLGKKPPEGAFGFAERFVVLEIRPDKGYRSIRIGGNEILHPYTDNLNEKGLYVTVSHDPQSVGHEASPASGVKTTGISLPQLTNFLLDSCATVEEAKMKILENHLTQNLMNIHVMIADAGGNATVFELGPKGDYFFTDRKASEPLFCTNHALSQYPEPGTYPDFDINAGHNTFARQLILRDAYAGLSAPFKKEDVSALINSVHCSFVDANKCDSAPMERTLVNTVCDLTDRELSVRWYLGDVKPVPGTNQMEDRMTDFYTFGFDDK